MSPLMSPMNAFARNAIASYASGCASSGRTPPRTMPSARPAKMRVVLEGLRMPPGAGERFSQLAPAPTLSLAWAPGTPGGALLYETAERSANWLASVATTAMISPGSIGFEAYMSKPAPSARVRSSTRA